MPLTAETCSLCASAATDQTAAGLQAGDKRSAVRRKKTNE